MSISIWILIFMSVTEAILLIALIVFFSRLRKSEHSLNELQANQEKLLAKLHFNAELEQELMESFAERQQELRHVDMRLGQRAEDMRKLLEQAEGISRSPQFLREIILNGRQKGRSTHELAKATGLSIDEVELILMKAR